jgi:tetratricopeptide (TPR) repeat protein
MNALSTAASRVRIGLLLAAGLLAYANAFTGAFQFDDTEVIFEDARLASAAAFGAKLDQMIRPFVKLTFLIDRGLYGDQPTGYHLFNLFFHLGSGLLLYRLLRSAVRMTATKQELNSFGVPFWVTLLFLIHPTGTETVTYISGRPTGMMTFFYLAALALYLRATPDDVPRPWLHISYWGALACFALALLCKETAMTFPAILLLWDLIVRRRQTGASGGWLRHRLTAWLPFWGMLLLAVWAASAIPRYAYLARHSLELRSVADNLVAQINVVAYSLSLFVRPDRLTFDHDFPPYSSLLAWPTPASLALLAGLLVVAVVSARRRPLIGMGLLWFFVTLAPTNNVIPRFDLLSERNLYLPSIGLFLAVVALLDECTDSICSRLTDRTRRALALLPIAVAALLITATHVRNRVYADQVAFWSDAAAKSPGKARAHNNAGYAYYLHGDFDRAIDHFRTAVTLDPDSDLARENLRLAWEARKGRLNHFANEPAPARMP